MKISYKKSLIACLVFIIISGCTNNEKHVAKKEKYHVVQPMVKDTTYFQEYIGEVQSYQHVEIRSRVRGFIEKNHVDEGKFVRKGQLLFSISSHEYREELLKAKAVLKSVIAEAKSAELDYLNTKSLSEKSVVSKAEVEMAKSKLDALNAKIEEALSVQMSAQLRLSYTEVRAPFDGIIDRIPNKKGSLIDEGTLLSTISDNSQVYVYFNVSEKEYLDFATSKIDPTKKTKVRLVLANNQEHTYSGYIETVEGEVNKETGSIAFRAIFPNPEKLLHHGSSCKIKMDKEIKKAIIIPQKSTFEIQDQVYVYALNKDNKVIMKSFIPKMRMPHIFIVETGIETTDRLIYEGIQTIKEGDLVSPDTLSLKTILAQFH
jgi:RND family efflux transporter MFP subunit